jgi:aryl-alcohol dehydrogenase-like predicted oxidoreductase
MIEKIPFGDTGHLSSRILFGAAALGSMPQAKADALLPLLLNAGVNHIDVAASYGDAELRLAPWLKTHRADFFVATKTGERTRDGAYASIEKSLQRMQIEQIDMIQFHNLTDETGWSTAMGSNGALAAAVEAREQGLVRYIGVTGHGTRVAEMHLKSLGAFDFDAVLLPYNHTMMQDPVYAADFESLYSLCMEKKVAMQTIKSIARRRWQEGDDSPKFSWYEPIRDEQALRRAVHWVLRKPGIFLNSSSDATLLPALLEAASAFSELDSAGKADLEVNVAADMHTLDAEALFVRGISDEVRL